MAAAVQLGGLVRNQESLAHIGRVGRYALHTAGNLQFHFKDSERSLALLSANYTVRGTNYVVGEMDTNIGRFHDCQNILIILLLFGFHSMITTYACLYLQGHQ